MTMEHHCLKKFSLKCQDSSSSQNLFFRGSLTKANSVQFYLGQMFIVDVWENEIAIPLVNIKKFIGKMVNISRTKNKVWVVFREPG